MSPIPKRKYCSGRNYSCPCLSYMGDLDVCQLYELIMVDNVRLPRCVAEKPKIVRVRK